MKFHSLSKDKITIISLTVILICETVLASSLIIGKRILPLNYPEPSGGAEMYSVLQDLECEIYEGEIHNTSFFLDSYNAFLSIARGRVVTMTQDISIKFIVSTPILLLNDTSIYKFGDKDIPSVEYGDLSGYLEIYLPLICNGGAVIDVHNYFNGQPIEVFKQSEYYVSYVNLQELELGYHFLQVERTVDGYDVYTPFIDRYHFRVVPSATELSETVTASVVYEDDVYLWMRTWKESYSAGNIVSDLEAERKINWGE